MRPGRKRIEKDAERLGRKKEDKKKVREDEVGIQIFGKKKNYKKGEKNVKS